MIGRLKYVLKRAVDLSLIDVEVSSWTGAGGDEQCAPLAARRGAGSCRAAARIPLGSHERGAQQAVFIR